MILNLYDEILSFQEIGGDMADRLRKMNVYHLFQKLDEKFQDKSIFNKVLFYLVRVYSYKSDELILGVDIPSLKERVFDELEIPRIHFEEIILMRCPVIASTVYDYLSYQEAVTFKHYMCAKDLYNQMLHASLDYIKDANDNIDYQKKFNCSEYADKLYDKVQKWEKALHDERGPLKEERKKAKENRSNLMGIEQYVMK